MFNVEGRSCLRGEVKSSRGTEGQVVRIRRLRDEQGCATGDEVEKGGWQRGKRGEFKRRSGRAWGQVDS